MRILNATEVAAWVRDELLNPARERPIVAVTTRPHDGGVWTDPRALDEAIRAFADIVFIETGDATWELADALALLHEFDTSARAERTSAARSAHAERAGLRRNRKT